jgi:cytosine/adenosine deaminase-related metal-dependent hydrolase
MVYITKFEADLRRLVKQKHGIINAHAHLDRAETLDKRYLAHVGIGPVEASTYPLSVKQNLTGDLHRGPAYTSEDLRRRMSKLLEAMAECFDVVKVYSLIDTTADIGRKAFDIALELKNEFRETIDFRVGSYPIFGFKDNEPDRWKVFEDASQEADFVGALPERDEKEGHIGYKEHLRRILYLAAELGKPVHVHVDQANNPNENGTEELVHATSYCIPPEKRPKEGEPLIWAVHAISPSAYDESRFNDMLDGLYECNIGVICCPTAAISMKQNRNITVPTHNSIARICEMMVRGITVRMGSDNIADVFVPSATADMYVEAMNASNFVRFYKPDVWAKLLTGEKLNEMDKLSIKRSLDGER